MDQQYSLRWNNYLNQITHAFDSFKNEEDLVDVTLSCEGKKLKAHKMLLSACSAYFRDIFKENPCQHPVIVFKNFKFVDLEAIVDFMYKGEVDVRQENFESFLGAAELLEVKGLTEGSNKTDNFDEEDGRESKIISSKISMLPDQPRKKSVTSTHQPDQPEVFPEVPASSPQKKRKSSFPQSDNTVKSSEKKQKSTDVHVPIIPKIESEEFIEDLTFDEESTDDSHSTTTDPSQLPLRDSRPNSSTGYSAGSIQDNQDLSQLPKGLVHVPEPGSSMDLPPDFMQTEEIESPSSETKSVTEKKKEIVKHKVAIHNIEEDNSESVLKAGSSDSVTKITSSNLVGGSKNTLISKDVKPKEKQDDTSKATHKKLQDTSKNSVETTCKSKTITFPKGLSVIMKESNLMVSKTDEILEEETILRSEKAKTPIQEETNQDQLPEIYGEISTLSGQLLVEEPGMAEEAPEMTPDEYTSEVLQEKDLVEEEEPAEPEFDYFGCSVCKAECKPVDKFNLVLSHKCPICPCVCYCSHLLKEHMKTIHGWFNVQRRFKHY